VILATYPVLSGVAEAARVFDIVFVVVVLNAFVPGATIGKVTKWAGLNVIPTVTPRAKLEIASMGAFEGDLLSLHVHPSVLACDGRIRDLQLPDGTSIALVVRGSALVAARGSTVLRSGDQVYVLCRHEDRSIVTLLFGRAEDV
jgi:cell volume regulation protein A